jgi:hypothetical protein
MIESIGNTVERQNVLRNLPENVFNQLPNNLINEGLIFRRPDPN